MNCVLHFFLFQIISLEYVKSSYVRERQRSLNHFLLLSHIVACVVSKEDNLRTKHFGEEKKKSYDSGSRVLTETSACDWKDDMDFDCQLYEGAGWCQNNGDVGYGWCQSSKYDNVQYK